MADVKIDISIVFGGGDDRLVIACLESINAHYLGRVDIYVVSNKGLPATAAEIKRRWPKTILIENKEKRGFAANHNQIIRISKNSYILILNDDTIIRAGALEKMIEYLNNHPRVAAVSPKLLNPDGSLQPSTYSFPGLSTALINISGIRGLIPFNKFTRDLAGRFYGAGKSRFWEHDKTCVVDTLRGACVLMRRAAICEVGLMDEVCRAYGEETEWHCRFKRAGWKIVFLHNANVIHYGRQTTSREPITGEQIKGILNFFRRHKSTVAYQALRMLTAVIFFAKGVFWALVLRGGQAKNSFAVARMSLLFPERG